MIEDSKVVKKIEVKSGGKSGTYWTVTWADDKRDNIFNGDWLPLLEQSQKEGILLHYAKEKAEGSQYYNIKTLELAPPSAQGEGIKQTVDRSHEIEKNMFWKILADRIIHKDIDCATPEGKLMRAALNAKMLSVLEITLPSGILPKGKDPKAEEPKKGE